MANSARNKITLACTECKQRNYDNMKNKKYSEQQKATGVKATALRVGKA